MTCAWEEKTLGDIAQDKQGFVDGPFGSNLPASCYINDGVPVIRGSNLSLGLQRFRDNEFVFVSDDTLSRLSRSECVPGDIVFTKKGTLGQTGIVPRDGKYSHYLLSSNQMRLRVDPDVADENFVYLFVSSSQSIQRIKRDSEHTGVPKINLDYIKQFPICLPAPKEQKSIADVLISFDEKIELNRKQNRTLEAIAQTLFKRWFVEFEFPDENGQPYKSNGGAMQPSELGEIPVGWEVAKIGDAVEILGGGTPSSKVAEFWDDGDVDWYSPTDLTKSGALFSLGSGKKITQSGLQNSSAKLFPAYSLMMTSRATIGVVSINRTPACTNQGFIILVPSEEFSLYQLHGWLLQQLPEIHSMASGSTFKEISRGTFKDFDILKAAGGANFAKIVEPIYRKIETNILEIESLSQIRDTLLPKLMSGELRVV